MNFNSIVIWFFFVSTLTTFNLYGQADKFSLTIEFLPNFSQLTNEVFNEKHKLSYNGLLRIEYDLNKRIIPSIGFGYFNTGEFEKYDVGFNDIYEVKINHNYNYLLIPVGTKIYFGNFYFLPEIGVGFNVSNKMRTIYKFINGETEKVTKDEQLPIPGEFNKITIPIIMSLGKEFQLGKSTFAAGLKGYYGINRVVRDVPRNNHYYGFGILLGVKL